MRAARSTPTALAVVLATILVLGLTTLTTSATAAPTATTAERAAKPKIGIKIIKRGGKLVMLGNVRPPKGPVVVQKATSCDAKKGTCTFRGFKKVPVKKGRYQARVFAPKNGSWAWRAKIGNAYSEIWVTCKKLSPDNPCPTP